MANEHDVHDFVTRTAGELQSEYERIQRHAASDPGTAGDQGEENWAKLLREWLPPNFPVVTKGRILSESGKLSRQIDVLVLLPTYPTILRNSKHYLAGGVAAAFECKLTLKTTHVKDSVNTACSLGRMIPHRMGTPFLELYPQIIFGLLAHSHSWKGPTSTPVENVTAALWEADAELVQHPSECLNLLCVADLATWQSTKRFEPVRPPSRQDDDRLPPVGSASTSYICHSTRDPNQTPGFSPVGRFLMSLYAMLAWTFPEMRALESYFLGTLLAGNGMGRVRLWPPDVFSDVVRDRIFRGEAAATRFDPWCWVLD
jgi:uncharacterized protein DUF6602